MDGEDDEVPLVGDMSIKFNSLFFGIDNICFQESLEYAENKLKLLIAKATAKEACSKFMQELSEFMTDSLEEASPALEENGCYGVLDSEMLKGDKDNANEQIISSYCSSTEGETQSKQTGGDLAGEKEPNITAVNDSCSMLVETKMVVQPTPNMHVLSTGLTSISAMATEKKCDCSEANRSEDGEGDASPCHRRKHQRQNSEESEWQFEDFSDSDWEII